MLNWILKCMKSKIKKIATSLILISFLSLVLVVQISSSKVSSTNQSSNPPTFVPLNSLSVDNYSVELQISEPIATLMNSSSNVYIIIVYGLINSGAIGSTNQGFYNALVLLGSINGNEYVNYAFAPDIMTNPLAFTQGSASMLQEYSNNLVVTFTEYAVYNSHPTIVSALVVLANESLFEFETDLNGNLNFNYQPYLSMNVVTASSSSSVSNSISTLQVSSSSRKTSLPGFELFSLILLYPVSKIIRSKRKK